MNNAITTRSVRLRLLRKYYAQKLPDGVYNNVANAVIMASLTSQVMLDYFADRKIKNRQNKR